MISLEVFLTGLMLVSTFTSLATEAIKKIFVEHNIKYHANTLAGIVSVILSAFVGIGYTVITSTAFSAQIVVCIIALMFLGWLGAMVGYDKIISQFKSNKKD